MIKKITHTLLFLCFLPLFSSAQKWSLGVSAGTALYQGDITERFRVFTREYKMTVGGFVKYQLNDKINIKANYLRGTIIGDEGRYLHIAWRKARGFKFESPISEVSTVVEWDFLKKRFGTRYGSKGLSFSLFVLGGLGYVKTNPQVDFNEPNPFFEDVNIDKLAQYSRTHLILPMGLGVKWHITPQTMLSIELGNRTTFTDYLDGISKTAQPKYGDWYLVGLVSFSQQISFRGNNSSSHIRISKASVSCPRF